MEPIPFWSFVFRSLGTAAADTADFFGWDVKTIVTGAVLLGLGFFLLLRVKGESETRQEVGQFLIVTAAPILLFLVGLFLYNCFRSPYLIYISEYSKAQQRVVGAETAVGTTETARQAAERKVGELEKELAKERSERPMITPTNDIIEIARLASQLDQRARHKSIRDEITKHLNAASRIMQECLSTEEKPVLADQANAWAKRNVEYLTSVEPSYAARFNTATGPTYSHGSAKVNEDVWNFVNLRVVVLSETLKELRD